jgi:hypothetical protein
MRKPSLELLDLLAACSPGVARLTLALRELVLKEAPEADEVLYSVYAEVIVFKFPGRPGSAFCNARLSCRSGQRLRNPRDETSDAATLNWALNCFVLGHLQGDPI